VKAASPTTRSAFSAVCSGPFSRPARRMAAASSSMLPEGGAFFSRYSDSSAANSVARATFSQRSFTFANVPGGRPIEGTGSLRTASAPGRVRAASIISSAPRYCARNAA
jgi:hypothetical protein